MSTVGIRELKNRLTRYLRQTKHRSEEHTSELQSLAYLVCRLLLEKKKKNLTVIICIAEDRTGVLSIRYVLLSDLSDVIRSSTFITTTAVPDVSRVRPGL